MAGGPGGRPPAGALPAGALPAGALPAWALPAWALPGPMPAGLAGVEPGRRSPGLEPTPFGSNVSNGFPDRSILCFNR